MRKPNNLPLYNNKNGNETLGYQASLSEKIEIICSPLFEFLSLQSFSYSKINRDGKFFYVSTHKDWLKIFHEDLIYNSSGFQKDYYYLVDYGDEGGFLYMGESFENEFLSQLYHAGIWNCLTLFLRNQDVTECWTFSSTPLETKVLNLYINRPDIFKHFSTYFNRELQGLVDFNNPNIYAVMDLSRPEILSLSKKEKASAQQLEIHKFYLSGEMDGIYLSKREIECLYYLAKGNTVKEIGKSLSISPRTVEVYIENAKMKTQLKSKIELLDMFEQEGFKDALHFSLNYPQL